MNENDRVGSAPDFLYNDEGSYYDGANDVLSILLRKVCRVKCNSVPRWLEMSDNYFRDRMPDMPPSKITRDKRNLADALSKGMISMKVFTKAIMIIANSVRGGVDVEFSVTFKPHDKDEPDEKFAVTLESTKPKRGKRL